MRIEYQKPWFLKPKLTEEQTNIITRGGYSINITFKIDKSYNKDNKVGTLDIKLTIKSFTEIGMINPVYDSMTLTVNLVNTGYVPPSLTNY